MKPTISASKSTPEQINAAVAEYVEGWKLNKMGALIPPGLPDWPYQNIPHYGLPAYSADANAVLPLLGCSWKAQQCEQNLVWVDGDFPKYGDAAAKTFPLAACFALLRAHGVTVTD